MKKTALYSMNSDKNACFIGLKEPSVIKVAPMKHPQHHGYRKEIQAYEKTPYRSNGGRFLFHIHATWWLKRLGRRYGTAIHNVFRACDKRRSR